MICVATTLDGHKDALVDQVYTVVTRYESYPKNVEILCITSRRASWRNANTRISHHATPTSTNTCSLLRCTAILHFWIISPVERFTTGPVKHFLCCLVYGTIRSVFLCVSILFKFSTPIIDYIEICTVLTLPFFGTSFTQKFRCH